MRKICHIVFHFINLFKANAFKPPQDRKKKRNSHRKTLCMILQSNRNKNVCVWPPRFVEKLFSKNPTWETRPGFDRVSKSTTDIADKKAATATSHRYRRRSYIDPSTAQALQNPLPNARDISHSRIWQEEEEDDEKKANAKKWGRNYKLQKNYLLLMMIGTQKKICMEKYSFELEADATYHLQTHTHTHTHTSHTHTAFLIFLVNGGFLFFFLFNFI